MRDDGNTREGKDETRNGPRLPRNAHKRKRGKIWATVACFSAKQGLGIYIESESVSVAVQCTLCRERERLGEKKAKSKGESCRRQIARHHMRKESGIQSKSSKCDIEARQRAQGRKERQKSMSDGKGGEGEAKERGNGSRIKKERRNIRRGP